MLQSCLHYSKLVQICETSPFFSNCHKFYFFDFLGGLFGFCELLLSFDGRCAPFATEPFSLPRLNFPVVGSFAMRISVFISNKRLERQLDFDVKQNEVAELKRVDPFVISALGQNDLRRYENEGILHLTKQLDNIKSIDDRAMKLMSAMGIVFSLAGALIVSLVRSDSIDVIYGEPIIFITFSFLFTIIGLIMCLAIIQSIKVSPPGYSPTHLSLIHI